MEHGHLKSRHTGADKPFALEALASRIKDLIAEQNLLKAVVATDRLQIEP